MSDFSFISNKESSYAADFSEPIKNRDIVKYLKLKENMKSVLMEYLSVVENSQMEEEMKVNMRSKIQELENPWMELLVNQQLIEEIEEVRLLPKGQVVSPLISEEEMYDASDVCFGRISQITEWIKAKALTYEWSSVWKGLLVVWKMGNEHVRIASKLKSRIERMMHNTESRNERELLLHHFNRMKISHEISDLEDDLKQLFHAYGSCFLNIVRFIQFCQMTEDGYDGNMRQAEFEGLMDFIRDVMQYKTISESLDELVENIDQDLLAHLNNMSQYYQQNKENLDSLFMKGQVTNGLDKNIVQCRMFSTVNRRVNDFIDDMVAIAIEIKK